MNRQRLRRQLRPQATQVPGERTPGSVRGPPGTPGSRGPPETLGGEGDTPQRMDRGTGPGSQSGRSPTTPSPETLTDDFILDVLRGWRLLQAASLTLEECRDVLSSTGNRLDFESVSHGLADHVGRATSRRSESYAP